MNKLVSVIIPAYNAGIYITDTIVSVLNQTWENIEIIVINDGSTDNTGAIVKSIASENPKIKYFEYQNMGCSAAKNIGLSHAIGDYIQYLDADDLLSNDKIEMQINAIKHNPLALAICKTVIFQETLNCETGFELDTDFLYSTHSPYDFLLNLYGLRGREGMIQPNAYLMHRNLSDRIGTWDTSLSPSPDEDGEYFCRAIISSSEIVFTRGVNYYRKLNNSNSLSNKNSRAHASGALRSVKLKSNHLLKVNSSYIVRRIIAKQYGGLVYLYGINYPDVINEVKVELNSIGFSKIPPVGGAFFKALSYCIGVINVLHIKRRIINYRNVNNIDFKFTL